MFPYFTLFGRTIGMYGVCAALGLLTCGFVCYFCVRKFKIESENIIFALLSAGGGIIIGGHLLYGIVDILRFPSKYGRFFSILGDLSFGQIFSFLQVTFGGSVFYGGFLGSIVGVALYNRFTKKRGPYMDMLAFATPLFHCFGRIGCFLGGCCYGIESEFGFTAHGNTIATEGFNDVSRFPVQLFEAFFNLAIFLILLTLFRKEKFRGRLILLYMLMYAPVRFTLEFLRGDTLRGIFFGLSTSQWISLILFAVSATMLTIQLIKKYKSGSSDGDTSPLLNNGAQLQNN